MKKGMECARPPSGCPCRLRSTPRPDSAVPRPPTNCARIPPSCAATGPASPHIGPAARGSPIADVRAHLPVRLSAKRYALFNPDASNSHPIRQRALLRQLFQLALLQLVRLPGQFLQKLGVVLHPIGHFPAITEHQLQVQTTNHGEFVFTFR